MHILSILYHAVYYKARYSNTAFIFFFLSSFLALFTTMVTEVNTKEEFDAALANNSKVACDFYATWCGPCLVIGPKFAEEVGNYPEIKFIKVDVDKNEETSTSASISAMPTFKFYHNGSQFEELVGSNESKLKEMLGKLKAL